VFAERSQAAAADIGEARYLLEEPAVFSVAAPKKSRLGWILALGFAAAASFAALWLQPAPLPKVVRFEIHAPPGSTLPLGTPAISPDGHTIALTVKDPDGVTRIHLRPMDRIETHILPGTEGAFGVHKRSISFEMDRCGGRAGARPRRDDFTVPGHLESVRRYSFLGSAIESNSGRWWTSDTSGGAPTNIPLGFIRPGV
jgi:hypothetical protein